MYTYMKIDRFRFSRKERTSTKTLWERQMELMHKRYLAFYSGMSWAVVNKGLC